MQFLSEIQSFLSSIGFEERIDGLQPLTQFDQPTAFRVIFKPWTFPQSIIIKHIPNFEDTSVSDRWLPRWKVAQDYINLCFINEVTDGSFAPKVYGYSEHQNMIAIEDLGNISLHGIQPIPQIGENIGLWQDIARVLARLLKSCPRDPRAFERFAHNKLQNFSVLEKWDDQDPANMKSIVGIAREMGFEKVNDLGKEVTRMQHFQSKSSKRIRYSVGDLWHQHIMFHNGQIKFIDYHCGGYDIVCTDLMRLAEGTPLYQDKPIPRKLVNACKDSFFKEFLKDSQDDSPRDELEEIYDFCLLRHICAMVEREIIQLRRPNQCKLVTKAVSATLNYMKGSKYVRKVVVQFLTELEKLPNKIIEQIHKTESLPLNQKQ